ncbi:collagen alpha-1(I) chain-like [Cydia splendana]|uniref:collagen alpha-1(I) chain-like n=1 Tax=Cydia splendana TaxID=1100963 RepID=UPI00300D855A
MTSKKPKTELVAICKLEFYRKQKNWKFCSQKREAKDSNKKRSKSTNAKLNQTYNIAPAPKKPEAEPVPAAPEPAEPEEQQNLNEAFVEAETGTASESDEPPVEGQDILKDVLKTETGKPSSQSEPPWSPYSPRWSIQRWAERHRLWNTEPTQPHRGHNEAFVPQNDEMNVGKEWDDREWCAGEGAAWSEPGWLAEAAALGVCGGVGGGVCRGGGGGGGPGGEDAVDGDWRRDLSSVSRCDSLPSVASSEFIRGAALAPHSTQIDLLLGPEPATALTGPALAAAVARHTAALRELLHEAQRRQQIPSKEAPTYDEIPVRDPGPTQYHLPLRFNDPIVAGSYRTTPDLQGQTGQAGQICDPGPTQYHLPLRFNDPIVAGSYRTTPDLQGQTGQARQIRDPGPSQYHLPLRYNDPIVAGSYRTTPDLQGQTGQAGQIRDPGPTQYHLPLRYNDPIVAGSYRNTPDLQGQTGQAGQVRDPGPTQYHLPLSYNDPIVAGSYRTTPDLQGQTGQAGQIRDPGPTQYHIPLRYNDPIVAGSYRTTPDLQGQTGQAGQIRDPGPSQYHLPLRYNDPIVASSYRNTPDLQGQTGQAGQVTCCTTDPRPWALAVSPSPALQRPHRGRLVPEHPGLAGADGASWTGNMLHHRSATLGPRSITFPCASTTPSWPARTGTPRTCRGRRGKLDR